MNTSTKNRQGRSGSGNRRHSYSSHKSNTRSGSYQGGGSRRPQSGRSSSHTSKGRSGRKMPTFDPSRFINTNPVSVVPDIYTAKNTFETFGFTDALAKNAIALGLTIPSPIQDRIIPEIMNGHDVIGLAETGTGKTAAFLLPLIEKTIKDTSRRTLILAPTRELAIQIEDELRKLSRGLRIFSVTCVGGMNIYPQIKALRRSNHFVIGTPGRILDLIKRKNFLPGTITTVVLDEADRMLDMGFIHDMREILSNTPNDRETLFFSATMTHGAKDIVNDFLRDPVMISVKKKDVTDSIAQDIVRYNHTSKFETLLSLLKDPAYQRVLIFGSMKHSVERLAKELSAKGIEAESIHGNKNHSQRQRALQKFKAGRVQVLVATDVAARGIHVENVTHVINYDLPNTFEDYVHRIGRTGRGSKRGKALTFVSA
ncbi:MAG: DEAD/DEAH box helicase [bacterium]|nr:DEAD/DEAH box helicase [bacterium]